MMKVLLVHALKEEQVYLEKEGLTFYHCITGVGKVNAAIAVQQAIYKYQPHFILNVGTCGSVHHAVGSIHHCHTFVDRDMEKLAAFGLVCKEDFEKELAEHALVQDWAHHSVCNSGDAFLTSKDGTGDVFDMEAFAIARVCKALNLPFSAVKYVTDIIGENSVKIWEEKLSEAQEALQNYMQTLIK